MTSRLLAVTVVCIWNAGCSSERDIGDATFIDHGAATATGRFEIDFGAVDLTKQSLHEYEVRRLPNALLTVGIEVLNPPEDWADGPLGSTVVTIQVEGGASRMLDVSEPLRLWKWSVTKGIPAQFGYVDTQSGDGRLDSDFRADSENPFVFHLNIEPPNGPVQPIDARLKAYGGGWK